MILDEEEAVLVGGGYRGGERGYRGGERVRYAGEGQSRPRFYKRRGDHLPLPALRFRKLL